jgi:hypothetical protein
MNDHPAREITLTEFGLPPSNMEGAFGNEGALRFWWMERRSMKCEFLAVLPPAATEAY